MTEDNQIRHMPDERMAYPDQPSRFDPLAALLQAKDEEIAYLRQQNGDLLRRLTELAQPGGNARLAAALAERAAARTTEPPAINRPPHSFSPRVLAHRRVDVVKQDDPKPTPEAANVADLRSKDIERSFAG